MKLTLAILIALTLPLQARDRRQVCEFSGA